MNMINEQGDAKATGHGQEEMKSLGGSESVELICTVKASFTGIPLFVYKSKLVNLSFKITTI